MRMMGLSEAASFVCADAVGSEVGWAKRSVPITDGLMGTTSFISGDDGAPS
uniref:Uncharacterized protein n=1 Tax=Candidatus Kentrum sp. TUN TaxID=2126343 RepID=A0A450ZZF7_9GAMM|nr:MAG: hypothetical protein BECKTUN1418F_GA0071002_10554 [Candidatus Kentron sp. TUN]VFK59182.1 MAG: hypothetical protein BECKTUN1418E_GA0071001_10524 [Candidatus Kentron sp. TUN]